MTAIERTIELILNELGYDPLAALDARNADRIPIGRNKIEDALKVLERHGAELLLPYLTSDNSETATDALHVFSELGSIGYVLIEHAVKCLSHSYPSARWYVLDGLLLHLPNLSPAVLAMGIKLAGDETVSVRKKAIEFIAGLPTAKIEAAQGLLSPKDRIAQHRTGLEILSRPSETEKLIDRIAGSEKVVSCYICARILKAAKSNYFFELSDQQVTCEEAAFVRSKLDLLKTSAEWRAKLHAVKDSVFEINPETLKIKGDLDRYKVPDADLDQAIGELEDSLRARRLEQLDRRPGDGRDRLEL